MPILRCTEAFAVQVGNVPRVLRPGDLVEANDPIVKGRADKFEPVETHVERTANVEQATAAPGEKRSVSTAKKTASHKKD